MGTPSDCVFEGLLYRDLQIFQITVYSASMKKDNDLTNITERTAQNTPTDFPEQLVSQLLVDRKWTRLSDLRIPSPWRTWLQSSVWGQKFAQWRLRYLLRRLEEFQQRKAFTLAIKYCLNILRWNPCQPEIWRRLGEILCQQADVLLALEQKPQNQTTSAQNIQPQTYKVPQGTVPQTAPSSTSNVEVPSQSDEDSLQPALSLPPQVQLCCENALFCLNEAMRQEPDSPALYLLRAEIFERLGQDEPMEADLLQAERLEFAHAENVPIVNGVVDFHLWQEQWIAEWRPICTQLIESQQNGKFGLQNEVRNSMLKTIALQIRLAPCFELYMVQMALFQYLNMKKESSAAFGNAVRLVPVLENYRNYITYLTSTHQFQDAIQWSLEGSQRFPKDVRLVCLRVQSRILMKDTEEALKDLRHAAELAPLNMHIWYGLVMWLLKTERFETALRVCDLAIPYIVELKKQGHTYASVDSGFDSESGIDEKTGEKASTGDVQTTTCDVQATTGDVQATPSDAAAKNPTEDFPAQKTEQVHEKTAEEPFGETNEERSEENQTTREEINAKHSANDRATRGEAEDKREENDTPEEPETLDEALLRIRIQRIQALQKLNQTKLALTELDRIPEFHPGDNQALLITALMAHELDDEARQQRYFERCKTLQLENALQFLERSMLCRIHEQFEDALQDLDHAIALEPNDPHLLQERALILLQMNRLNEALETARQLQAASPELPTARLLLGDIYRVMDRPENAVVEYDQILKENPENIQALRGRAIAKYQLKLGDDALDDLAELLRLEPGNLEAARLRVEICTDLGRFSEARDELSRMLKQYPDHLGIRMGHGFAMTKEKNYPAALADFEFVYQQNPEMAAVPLARTHLSLGQYKAALAVLDDMLSLNPQFLPAMLEKASILLLTKQHRSLWKLTEQILKLDPGNAQILNFRGLLLIRKKKLRAAMDCFNQAIEQHPDSVLSYCHRSDLYMSIGDAEKALADLSTALELEPNWSLLYLNRARIYILLEDDNAAQDDIQMGMRLARIDGDERSIADAARLRKKLDSIQERHERFLAYTSDENAESNDLENSDPEDSDLEDSDLEDSNDSMDDDSMNDQSSAFEENLDDLFNENDHNGGISESDDSDFEDFDENLFDKSPFSESPFGKFDDFVDDDDSVLNENDFEDEEFNFDDLDDHPDSNLDDDLDSDLDDDDLDEDTDDDFDDSADEDDLSQFLDDDVSKENKKDSKASSRSTIDKDEFFQFVDEIAHMYSDVLEAAESDTGKPNEDESNADKLNSGKASANASNADASNVDESDAAESNANGMNADKPESGNPDTGRSNASKSDASKLDAGKTDAGNTNAGKLDTETPNASGPDVDELAASHSDGKSEETKKTTSLEGTIQGRENDSDADITGNSRLERTGKPKADGKPNKHVPSSEKPQDSKDHREFDSHFPTQHHPSTPSGTDIPGKTFFDDLRALLKSVLPTGDNIPSSTSQGALSPDDIRAIYNTDKQASPSDWDYYTLPLNDMGNMKDFPEAELMNEPIHEPDFIEQILPSEPDALPESTEESHGESTTESPKDQGQNTDSASKSDPEMP